MLLATLAWHLAFPVLASAQSSESFTAPNGFLIELSPNRSSNGLDTTLRITSPSGETMTFGMTAVVTDAKKGKTTFTSVVDSLTTISYEAQNGVVQRVSVTTPTESASAPAIPPTADSTYVPTAAQTAVESLMVAAVNAHSAAFQQEASDAVGAAQRGWIGCSVSIGSYILSFIGLVPACATVIFCVLAILAHYLAIAGIVCSCVPGVHC